MEKQTLEYYDFFDFVKKVDEKLGFDQRDCGKYFHPTSGKFGDWCDSKNYPEIDPQGKHRGSSQIWFKNIIKISKIINGKIHHIWIFGIGKWIIVLAMK